MTSPLEIVVWGASGHAMVVADAIRAAREYRILGFVDDVNPAPRQVRSGQVIGGRPELLSLRDGGLRHLVVAVGANSPRMALANWAIQHGFQLATIVHPASSLSPSATVGPGSVIVAGAIVNSGTTIASNVIINTGATVDHDCTISDGVHIAPGCHLAGHCTVGPGAFLGIGTIVRDRIRIGPWASTGAGSVLVEDVPERAAVRGVPAREVQNVASTHPRPRLPSSPHDREKE